MAQKLPVDRESIHQEDFNGHELRGIEKQNLERKNDLLIEAEMENAAVIDPDAVNSDKDNLSKDLLCRQASKASSSSDDDDEIDEEEEDEEEDEIEEVDEEIIDDYDGHDDDEVAMAKPITHVSHRDHEQRPKKRVALTSEASRQQHRGRNSRKDNRHATSSSEDDEDYVSDDVDDESEPGQRRRHSQTSASSSRRRSSKDDDRVTNWEEYVVRLREEQNPCKSVQHLINAADHILAGLYTSEASQQIIYALNREWLPRYAIVLLNRGYPAVSSQGNYMANIINQYLSKVLEIAIRLIEEPENINHIGEEFPLSEIMQDAVARILGDENASFYRRFDGRFESRRLDVGVNPSMMGIVGGAADTVEYDDSTSDIIAMEQVQEKK